MNKLCKKYINDVKAFFPIIGKNERLYIKKLSLNIQSYCEEVGVSSKEDLYKSYGKPYDIVNDYFSSVDPDYIIRKIKISKYIKAAVIALIAALIAAASVYCVVRYEFHQVAMRQEVVICETEIE